MFAKINPGYAARAELRRGERKMDAIWKMAASEVGLGRVARVDEHMAPSRRLALFLAKT